METIGNSKIAENEVKRTYRIEQLPGLSVVENLDYSEKNDRETILELLRNNPLGKNLGFSGLSKRIQKLNQGGDRSFFVKMKSNPTAMVDFILDRNGRSHTAFESSMYGDFNSKRVQYTRAGVLNEIIMSNKIKNIVASGEVQELASKYGFCGMKFAEPIFALTFKDNAKKALIYKNIKQKVGPIVNDFENFSEDLRKIFLQNGIRPNDLNPHQFIVTEQDGKPLVVLIDVESYIETEQSEQTQ
jgi:hypothetical protein